MKYVLAIILPPLGLLSVGRGGQALANLILWSFRKPEGTVTPAIFGIPYLLSAIGVSWGSALLLARHRDRFRT